MNQLSIPEQTAFEKLKTLTTESIWSLAIKNVTDAFDPYRFRLLICQLKSQADDNPEVMKNILGDAYESVVSL